MGLIDMRQGGSEIGSPEPAGDIPELRRVAADSGFRIKRIRYYTPLVGGFVENILLRLAEKRLADRAKGAKGAKGAEGGISDEEALKIARAEGKQHVAQSGTLRAVLRVLSAAMKLDLLFFGHVESGPFFALLERTSNPGSPDSRSPVPDSRSPIPDPRPPTPGR